MNDVFGGLTTFFYNILPGVYLLLLLSRPKRFILHSTFNSTLEIIIFLTVSLLIGFVFQGLTKIVREWGLDEKIYKEVIENNDLIWNKAVKIFTKLNLFNKNIEIKITNKYSNQNIKIYKQLFYLMDNYINSSRTNTLPTHFSNRTSLWANLVWANFILIFFKPIYLFNPLMLLFFLVTPYIAWLNLKAQQDTVLKSFLMEKDIIRFKNKNFPKK